MCGQNHEDSCTVACEVCSCTGGTCEGDGDGDDDGGDDSGGGDGGDGGGEVCDGAPDPSWDECTADHATCAERCGPGPECWHACTADHATCAERCE